MNDNQSDLRAAHSFVENGDFSPDSIGVISSHVWALIVTIIPQCAKFCPFERFKAEDWILVLTRCPSIGINLKWRGFCLTNYYIQWQTRCPHVTQVDVLEPYGRLEYVFRGLDCGDVIITGIYDYPYLADRLVIPSEVDHHKVVAIQSLECRTESVRKHSLLKKLEISEGVVEILDCAFRDMSVETLMIPKSAVKFGRGAFEGMLRCDNILQDGSGLAGWPINEQDHGMQPMSDLEFGCVNWDEFARMNRKEMVRTICEHPNAFDDYFVKTHGIDFSKLEASDWVVLLKRYPEIAQALSYGGVSRWQSTERISEEEIVPGIRWLYSVYAGRAYIHGMKRRVVKRRMKSLGWSAGHEMEEFESWEGDGAYLWDCLKVITIPARVDGIPVYAFNGQFFGVCRNMLKMIVSEGIRMVCGSTRVNGFGNGPHEVVLPNTLKYIMAYAFAGWSNLKTLVIPNGCVSIGDEAFANCIGIERIVIPKTVKRIGRRVNTLEGYCIGDEKSPSIIGASADCEYVDRDDPRAHVMGIGYRMGIGGCEV